jgi:hypothetical protein
MFSWHETTRCRICRVIFAALGILPLCAVLLAAAWIGTPGSTRYFESEVGRQLALRASLEAVRLPRPGVVEYKQLKLVDPETRKVVGVFELLQVDNSGSETKITCNQPELNQDRFDLLWEHIWRFSRQQAVDKKPCELTAKRLALWRARGSAIELYDLQMKFVTSQDGPQVVVSFRADPHGQVPRSQLSFSRKSPSGSALTILESKALPVDLVRAICPDPVWEPKAAARMFTGTLHWQEQRVADVQGQPAGSRVR